MSASATSAQPRFGAATTSPSTSRTSPGTDTPQPIPMWFLTGGGEVVELVEEHVMSAMVSSTSTRSRSPGEPDSADDRTVECDDRHTDLVDEDLDRQDADRPIVDAHDR